jgi:hypothetical protein
MQIHQVCIEESDGIVGAPDENRAKPLVERASDQTIVTITRDRKEGREVTGILFIGDFQDWCRAQSKMSSTGAMLGSGGRIASRSENGPEGLPLTSCIYRGKLERAKGFEPSTPTLARFKVGGSSPLFSMGFIAPPRSISDYFRGITGLWEHYFAWAIDGWAATKQFDCQAMAYFGRVSV